MRLSANPEASKELANAIRYYESNAPPGTAYRFLEAVDATLDLILAAPLQAADLGSDVRRWRVKGFPYGIYYRVDGDMVRVLCYKHDRRDPALWLGRT